MNTNITKQKLIKLSQALGEIGSTIENTVKNVGGYAPNILRQVNEKYRSLEREVNELARASGMSDQTYDDIVVGLVEKRTGTEIQVLEMMKEIFINVGNSVNFQDPININAIFGGIDKVTENIGGSDSSLDPESVGRTVQTWVKDQLIPTIQEVKKVGLNPKQLTSIINNAVNSSIGASSTSIFLDAATNQEVPYINVVRTSDGSAINKETGQKLIEKNILTDVNKNQEDLLNISQSALAQGSKSWEEFTGLQGDQFKNTMDLSNKIRNTTIPISMRPDDQQRLLALQRRDMTGLNQSYLDLLQGIERGLGPSTLLAIEDAQRITDQAADKAPGAIDKLGIIPQSTTLLHQTITDPLLQILNPGKALSPGKVASTKSRLIKIAEIENTPTSFIYTNDPNNPEPVDQFNPQPVSGAAAWQSDVAQADIATDAASQARELEWNAILGQSLNGQIMKIEKDSEMYSQHIQKFETGLGDINQLQREGITDEDIVAHMQPMLQQLVDQYETLLQLYDMAAQKISARLDLAAKGDPSLSGTVFQIEGFREELAAKAQDVIYKRNQAIMDSKTIVPRMKQKLQETVVTDTLQRTNDLYESMMGSTIARGELAASQAAEAKQLMDASQAAGTTENGMSPVMQARLKQKAIEKLTKSMESIDGSAKSPISGTGDRLQMLGI